MEVYFTPVPLRIHDAPTLEFISHCYDHWDDEVLCSRTHVRFMHYLVRFIFDLTPGMPLHGVRFHDSTLAMVNPQNGRVFFALTKREGSWRAVRVAVAMVPRWSADVGFFEGLQSPAENNGPKEDD